jgi:hypothetical protein
MEYSLLAGRTIARRGKPFVTIHRVADTVEYNSPTDADRFARLCSAAPDMARLLERILAAHESGNNGAVMGEAVLCEHFAAAARRILDEAGVQR